MWRVAFYDFALLAVLCVSHRSIAFFTDNLGKRAAPECPPYSPFKCPDGKCIALKYVCDGSADCPSKYDEDMKVCTAINRPPVDDTSTYLKDLLTTQPTVVASVFGNSIAHKLQTPNGVEQVAIALTVSPTLTDFAEQLTLTRTDVEYIYKEFKAIQEEDSATAGFSVPATDIKFYVDKLVNTGFLDIA